MSLAKAYHAFGRKAESDAALAEPTRRYAKDAAFNIAYTHAYRGEHDLAFEWRDKAVQCRDPGLSDIATFPSLAKLHNDPRWLPLLRKLGRSPEQLAGIEFDVGRVAPLTR